MAQIKQISSSSIIRHWKFIITTVAVLASLAFFVSTLITPQFKSEADVLILQKNLDTDPYRAAKSSEYAGEVLGGVASSSDFMNGVLSKMGENANKFGSNPEDQIKNWKKAVNISPVVNTGIIKITVLDPSKRENRKLMEATLSELQSNGVNYHGNENITLKKIGGPVYFENPAYPIIWINILASGAVGIFLSVGLILLFGENFENKKSRKPEIVFQNELSGQSFYHQTNIQ
jgi:capsular polysaccharide biosynthesis protein